MSVTVTYCLNPPSGPLSGLWVKYLNFAITKSVFNNFTEPLNADKSTIDMKHIKWNFSLKA